MFSNILLLIVRSERKPAIQSSAWGSHWQGFSLPKKMINKWNVCKTSADFLKYKALQRVLLFLRWAHGNLRPCKSQAQ